MKNLFKKYITKKQNGVVDPITPVAIITTLIFWAALGVMGLGVAIVDIGIGGTLGYFSGKTIKKIQQKTPPTPPNN